MVNVMIELDILMDGKSIDRVIALNDLELDHGKHYSWIVRIVDHRGNVLDVINDVSLDLFWTLARIGNAIKNAS